MSELSPTAQEVFWAFNKAASGEPDDWHYLPAVAAALRAAADQLKYKLLDVEVVDCSQLRLLADELEAQ
ncbi:hypothetical protein EBT25_09190 [bacterium]|nr:hypothetical protein [bacterium]